MKQVANPLVTWVLTSKAMPRRRANHRGGHPDLGAQDVPQRPDPVRRRRSDHAVSAVGASVLHGAGMNDTEFQRIAADPRPAPELPADGRGVLRPGDRHLPARLGRFVPLRLVLRRRDAAGGDGGDRAEAGRRGRIPARHAGPRHRLRGGRACAEHRGALGGARHRRQHRAPSDRDRPPASGGARSRRADPLRGRRRDEHAVSRRRVRRRVHLRGGLPHARQGALLRRVRARAAPRRGVPRQRVAAA